MVAAGQLDEPGVGQVLREPAPVADVDEAVVDAEVSLSPFLTDFGTWTVGTTSRTSTSRNIRASAVIMPGLAVARCMRPKNARDCGSSAWLGATTSISDPSPQCGRISSSPASTSASAGTAQG